MRRLSARGLVFGGLALVANVGWCNLAEGAAIRGARDGPPPFIERFLAADADLIDDASIPAARFAYGELVQRATECPLTGALSRSECVIRTVFVPGPMLPVPEPSLPADSAASVALARGQGSCAAIAAIVLSIARDVGEPLEAWVLGEHVVVAPNSGAGYFELLREGRFVPWTVGDSGRIQPARGARVTATAFLGYYLDNIGVRLAAAGEKPRAEAAFQRAVAAAPTSARIRFNFGTFLLGEARVSEAIVQLRRAVRCDETNVESWTNLGVAYARAGKVSKARVALQRALRVDPHNAYARRNLEALTTASAGLPTSPR